MPQDIAVPVRESTLSDASTENRGSLVGARVLLCEDEAIILVQLNKILMHAGMEVVGSATNGRQGIEMAASERPDIVLMDLNIPIIDGMEASRRIIVEYGPCVVVLSAYGDADFRR